MKLPRSFCVQPRSGQGDAKRGREKPSPDKKFLLLPAEEPHKAKSFAANSRHIRTEINLPPPQLRSPPSLKNRSLQKHIP